MFWNASATVADSCWLPPRPDGDAFMVPLRQLLHGTVLGADSVFHLASKILKVSTPGCVVLGTWLSRAQNWCQPGLLWHIGCLKLSIPSENVIIHPEQKIRHRLYVLSKDVKCTMYLNTAVGQSTTAHVIFCLQYVMFDNILLDNMLSILLLVAPNDFTFAQSDTWPARRLTDMIYDILMKADLSTTRCNVVFSLSTLRLVKKASAATVVLANVRHHRSNMRPFFCFGMDSLNVEGSEVRRYSFNGESAGKICFRLQPYHWVPGSSAAYLAHFFDGWTWSMNSHTKALVFCCPLPLLQYGTCGPELGSKASTCLSTATWMDMSWKPSQGTCWHILDLSYWDCNTIGDCEGFFVFFFCL